MARNSSKLTAILGQTLRRSREGHLSLTRQLAEMVVLKLFYGLGPGHYHIARYWRKELSWRYKTGFWPYPKFRRFVGKLNPPTYQKLSQNKVCEKALLQMGNIPSPTFIGRLHYRQGFSATGEELHCAADLDALLRSTPGIEKLCFKPVEGFGGQGFQAVSCIRNDEMAVQMLDTGQVYSLPAFFAKVLKHDTGTDYIIEEYIEQHPLLAELNPSSVNTLRVWVASIGGDTAVIDAFLRVGRQGSIVDNISRGAQIFRVATASGLIGPGMEKNIFNDVFEVHRDSGEQITGVTLPFWPEAQGLAQRALDVFPHIMFAGVDVAITPQGPVVIELNVEPDPTSAIIFDRSHRELFACFDSTKLACTGEHR